MHLPHRLLALVVLPLLQLTHACLVMHATAPYDDDQPFEGTITDNGVLTCWIAMSYRRHMEWQMALGKGGQGVGGGWKFRGWEWECLEGYKAEAHIGRRSYTYTTHGRDFRFVASVREDVLGGRYVYAKRLFCEKDAVATSGEGPSGSAGKGSGNASGGQMRIGDGAGGKMSGNGGGGQLRIGARGGGGK